MLRRAFLAYFFTVLTFIFTVSAGAVVYPFSDDSEGAANWAGDAPWSIIDTDALSPTHSYCDSPGGNYDNDLDISLTLSSAIDLSAAVNPQLKFWHKCQLESGYDFGHVEISTDGGSSWAGLADYSGTSGTSPPEAQWVREQIDLSGYAGESSVLVRFRLMTDSSVVMDGWYVDDVAIADAANPVVLTVADPTTTSLVLNWSKSIDSNFAGYRIYRSTDPGVDTDDKLVATITELTTTDYIDTGLQPATTYYYRVFVFNAFDIQAGSNEESHATNDIARIYYADFESGCGAWTAETPWGCTTQYAHSGSQSLCDSPSADYQNYEDTSATISLYLVGSARPMLTFYQWYSLESYQDYGYVEVKVEPDGDWQKIFYVTGHSNGDPTTAEGWEEVGIDLAEYYNKNISIRLRLVTNGSTVYDGWYVDDVAIIDNPATASLPFFDDFEGGTGNWLTSGWNLDQYDFCSSTHSITDSYGGDHPDWVANRLVLAGTVDLTGAVNPQLRFCHHYRTGALVYSRVSVSPNNGHTWDTIWEIYNSETQDTRQLLQLDLSAYVGFEQVAIRFELDDRYNGNNYWGWSIDDVGIDDACANVVLDNPANVGEHSMELSWEQSMCPDFARYELYLSQNADMSDRVLVATFSDPSTTCYTDTDIPLVETTYYYQVRIVDADGFYNQGSNIVHATTTGWEPSGFPFSTNAEDPEYWGNDLPWDLTDGYAHTGTWSWTDSPDGDYENNLDRSLMTTVNLVGSARPMLTFYQWYSLESYQDYGYVEVKVEPDGDWQKIFYVTGHSNGDPTTAEGWEEVGIDLAEYYNKNISIRLRLVTNGSTVYDGWYVDDVAIIDNPATASLPFFDDFEGGTGNWLTSGWNLDQYDFCSSTHSITDSYGGDHPDWVANRLVLAGTVDLTGAVNPQLRFCHHYRTGALVYSRISVSPNNGHTWDTIWEIYNSETQDTRQLLQLDLSAYVGFEQVAIRFELDDRYNGNNYWGWSIDDVGIDDACANVVLDNPANVGEHSMELSWEQSMCPDFARYELYLSQNADMSDRVLVATFSDPSTTCYTDTDIPLVETTYYYQVRIVDADGFYNQGSNIVHATTTGWEPSGFPFSTNAEDPEYWGNDLPWDLTDGYAHTGTWSWTDSPDGDYENNLDRSLMTTVNLVGSARPMLTFYQWYSLESYQDYGYVEVKVEPDGDWQKIFYVTGHSNGDPTTAEGWEEVGIDLAEYYNKNISIRLRLVTNGSTVYDGWYVDDVAIIDNPATASLPFFDDFEGGTGNWLTSGWNLDQYDFCSSTHSITDSYGGDHPDWVANRLVLAGTVDLTGAVNPQLRFCHHYRTGALVYSRVSVSPNNGHTWDTIWEIYNSETQDTRQLLQLDLSAYVGFEQVAIRFELDDRYNGNNYWGWSIDDVYIGEPDANTMSVVPGTESLLLGDCLQFTAFNIFHEDITESATWSVRGDIGTIDENGLFCATGIGIGAIVAYDVDNNIKAISGIIEVVGSAGGTTQNENGAVFNFDDGSPPDGCLYFNAWIAGGEDEILTQASPGCGYEGGQWQVNVGNFASPWAPGEILHIDFIDKCSGENGALDIVLENGGQANDIYLDLISFDLVTTATTNVNAVTLVKNCGVASAEELVQLIPNASEIAYWSAENQAYVGHTKGSPVENFSLHPGYPYFVTVTADGTWTPTGLVPDPWPTFALITTGATNVNMIGMALDKLRITRAEELGHLIADANEIGRWVVENQAYEFHTYGAPLYDFAVKPAWSYFVTVADESAWEMTTSMDEMTVSGVPQNEGGYVYNSDGSLSADGEVGFVAYIIGREGDVLTENSPGCGVGSGYWQVNLGNFPSPWDAGEILHVDFVNLTNEEGGSLDITLEYSGQQTDITLLPVPCEGDFDCDGDVDGSDLASLVGDPGQLAWFAGHFGRASCP